MFDFCLGEGCDLFLLGGGCDLFLLSLGEGEFLAGIRFFLFTFYSIQYRKCLRGAETIEAQLKNICCKALANYLYNLTRSLI